MIGMEPGIYFDLDESRYHSAPGLSCSGMKQLSVSPLNYWHCNLNPDYERPQESGPQRWGKAIHCSLLEPNRFWDAYANELTADDFPGCLVTVDDLKGWMEANGMQPMTKWKKPDLIDRIQSSGLIHPPIWDVQKAAVTEEAAGKTLLKKREVAALERMGAVVKADPYATKALSGGMAEVSFFARDPNTGIMLKARMDYVKPRATIDLKSFSNTRGKPVDRAVFEAIYYEAYYIQCVFYSYVRELARQSLASGEIATHGMVSEEWIKGFIENDTPAFGFVFIESAEPLDLRIIQLQRGFVAGADANLYWGAGERTIAEMTLLYAECMQKYGDRPWREPRPPHVLVDTDMPQLLFS